jgi:hypothetical protein
MPKYYVPNLVLLNKTRTTTIILATIAIVTAISIIAAPIPKPALALGIPCQNCGAHESITSNGLGDLICSSGISYPNTQIKFNAIVPFKTTGPAKGSVTLTATVSGITAQGMILSGLWDPQDRPGTYSVSGTSTSDNICGIPGSPFTISGIIGPDVPITMGGGKYAFQGTGDVTASPAKKV